MYLTPTQWDFNFCILSKKNLNINKLSRKCQASNFYYWLKMLSTDKRLNPIKISDILINRILSFSFTNNHEYDKIIEKLSDTLLIFDFDAHKSLNACILQNRYSIYARTEIFHLVTLLTGNQKHSFSTLKSIRRIRFARVTEHFK